MAGVRGGADDGGEDRAMSFDTIETQRARRLLAHCALLGHALKQRVPARRRLEAALGPEQARRLLQALTGDYGRARRTERLRVRSAP
jgi:hypothetical protein